MFPEKFHFAAELSFLVLDDECNLVHRLLEKGGLQPASRNSDLEFQVSCEKLQPRLCAR